jgi:hypothetical protein
MGESIQSRRIAGAMSNSGKSNLARYRQLLTRTLFDLKLTRDLAESLKLPGSRIQRLARARLELIDEQIEANKSDTPANSEQG